MNSKHVRYQLDASSDLVLPEILYQSSQLVSGEQGEVYSQLGVAKQLYEHYQDLA